MNQNQELSSFSNYGSLIDWIAPGEDIRCADAAGDTAYKTVSGTSFAAAHVSAAYAVFLSAYPDSSYQEYTSLLSAYSTAASGASSYKTLVFPDGWLPSSVSNTGNTDDTEEDSDGSLNAGYQDESFEYTFTGEDEDYTLTVTCSQIINGEWIPEEIREQARHLVLEGDAWGIQGFDGCTSLESVEFNLGCHNSNTYIDPNTFFHCGKLDSLSFASQMCNLIIGKYAFSGTAVKKLTFPAYTTLKSYAFSDCPDLAKVTFRASAVIDLASSFYNCPSLTEMYLPGETLFSDMDSSLEYEEEKLFFFHENFELHYGSTSYRWRLCLNKSGIPYEDSIPSPESLPFLSTWSTELQKHLILDVFIGDSDHSLQLYGRPGECTLTLSGANSINYNMEYYYSFAPDTKHLIFLDSDDCSLEYSLFNNQYQYFDQTETISAPAYVYDEIPGYEYWVFPSISFDRFPNLKELTCRLPNGKNLRLVLDFSRYVKIHDAYPPVCTIYLDQKKLQENTDYTVEYTGENSADCLAGASITFSSSYAKYPIIYIPARDRTWEVISNAGGGVDLRNIAAATLKPSWRARDYNGSRQVPSIKLTRTDGVTIPSSGYSISINKPKSTDAGTYKMTIRGKGQYFGTRVFSYEIRKKKLSVNFSLKNTARGIKISWSSGDSALTGIKIYEIREYDDRTLLKKISGNSAGSIVHTYSRYSKGEKFTYRLWLQCPKGDKNHVSSWTSCKSLKRTFSATKLKKTKITSIQNVKKGIRLTWKKVSHALRYEVLRKEKGCKAYITLGTPKGTSFVDKKARQNRKYIYKIKPIGNADRYYYNYKDTSSKNYVGVRSKGRSITRKKP